MKELANNAEGSIQAFMIDPYSVPDELTSFYTFPVDGAPGTVQGLKIEYPQEQVFARRFHYSGNRIFFVNFLDMLPYPYYWALTNVDLVSGESWSKMIIHQSSFGPPISIDKDGNIIFVNGLQNSTTFPYFEKYVMEMYKLDPDGNIVWKKGLVLNKNNEPFIEGLFVANLQQDQQGNLYVTGRLLDKTVLPNSFSTEGHQFVLKLDSIGNPVKWIIIKEGLHFDGLLVDEKGIYLINKKKNHETDVVSDPRFVLLVKLDHNLKFQWGKKYFADNFHFASGDLKETISGNLTMVLASSGAFPIIVTELDGEGNILSQKGYPNYQPQVSVLDDGSFLFASERNFDASGETSLQMVVARTDTEGNIPGCVTYPTCLQTEEFTIETDTFQIGFRGVLDLQDVEVTTSPYTFSFSESCNFPAVPVPDFLFPDTLCIGDTAFTSNTYNHLAQARQWHLTGPASDSIQLDSFDFGHRFTEAGEYLLRHTVWVLGCSYEREQIITILPELEVEIVPEYVCPEGPFELVVQSDRQLQGYLWDNTKTGAVLPVAAPGLHFVQVSDGHCTAVDTAEIKFLADSIGIENPISLPPDTTICEIHLPYEIRPESDFSTAFFIDNDSSQNTFLLESAGVYQIEAEIEGCLFSASYELKTSDCEAAIYLPTTFSPNGDGINDEFYPMGKDFEMLELKIFDRWGGLVFTGAGADLQWSPVTDLSQGVYTFQFTFLNTLTGEEEVGYGSVTLLR